jgi:hypothetical protein
VICTPEGETRLRKAYVAAASFGVQNLRTKGVPKLARAAPADWAAFVIPMSSREFQPLSADLHPLGVRTSRAQTRRAEVSKRQEQHSYDFFSAFFSGFSSRSIFGSVTG